MNLDLEKKNSDSGFTILGYLDDFGVRVCLFCALSRTYAHAAVIPVFSFEPAVVSVTVPVPADVLIRVHPTEFHHRRQHQALTQHRRRLGGEGGKGYGCGCRSGCVDVDLGVRM